ncbi:Glycogen synthase [Pseudovibrio sp. Ad46]|uniref:glycosyltransferase family 4 protein n=1 Tax=unclassified Pseudovibrio TaxID=2627060 RepID=UPI0007AE9A58|nr:MULTISPECIES: glycosyltransferase family 4 protein [unclassified Pseudovibrio]KZK84479.1 Glycogen synthase [Pseudovibrio sp. Ad46]KZK92602.1 Glycogen synthase [Pseudovibrio sp. W74]KZL10357.1 Glycogen synthase [Pseudovibrio sp. Ad14]KZL22966.1 Glycogen synthase [Pseudovibrio sp. WM33]
MQIDTFAIEAFPNLDSYASHTSGNKLRVCIATEEILGPVRNGGIASTYYHLAKGLAARDHEVHILYLKGESVENETPQHWVKHFAEFGVALHYLQHTTETIVGPSQNWQGRYNAAYRWLKEQQKFDVVHSSEWRGGLIYALMAKKLGLAFQETLFIIKTSSPHLWNRHYQMQPIAKRDLLPASFAEQKCVELGDIVIGGSAHLLCFMKHVGYQLPAATYVQPNILDFSEIDVIDQRPPRKTGDRIHAQELTFFGRLEMRKGIELFCTALDLLEREGTPPKTVNFLGKYGEALSNQNNEKVVDFINRKAKSWSFEVNCVTHLNQPEALSFLCSRDMIAVMPSLIENSTMAVYEALEHNIPFIATDVGGTPELIAKEDHSACLIPPNAYELAGRLKSALMEGHPIAGASFSNQDNLKTWYGFHAYLGDLYARNSGKEATVTLNKLAVLNAKERQETVAGTLEIVVLLRESGTAMAFAKALLSELPDKVSILVTLPELEETARGIVEYLQRNGISSRLCPFIGFPAGQAFNRIMDECSADACILCDGTAVHFASGFCNDIRVAIQHQKNAIISSFVKLPDNKIVMPMGSDIVSEVVFGNSVGASVVCIPKKLIAQLSGLQPYDLRFGLLQEYVLRAKNEHNTDLMVIPECRLACAFELGELTEQQNNSNASYLRSMPLIENDNIAYRKLALLPHTGHGSLKLQPKLYRDKKRQDDEPVWLVHADRSRKLRNRWSKVAIGLDESASRILCVAIGSGERSLFANGTKQQISLINQTGETTLHAFDIPKDWPEGDRYNIKFHLANKDRTRSQFIRVIKLSRNVFVAVSGSVILNRDAAERMFSQHDTLFKIPSIAAKKKQPESISELKEATKRTLKQDKLTAYSGEKRKLFLTADSLISLHRPKRKLLRLFRGYSGSPIKASIPPKELFALNPTHIEGWAWDRRDTSKKLTVILEVNGVAMTEAKADRYIARFGSRNQKLAQHGFILLVPKEARDVNAEVTVKVKEDGSIVRNGKLRYLAEMLVAQ